MALTFGTKLGPYEIVAPVGAGGMGEVYRARDTRLDRTVAIKILPARLSDSPEAKQRFEREARAISSLNHPNICTLYDIGHQDGTDYLVMEYLEGETLADRLRKGPLTPEQVFKYGIEICEGLDRSHRGGVVHRDLKPGNIMLTKTGAKLMDFGLAKALPPSAPPASSLTMTFSGPAASSPLTEQGMVVGTFQYMSPEQVEGKEADARSDVFALGAVLYEMATGKRAFEGKTTASVIAAVLERSPAPISSVQPMYPAAFDRVVSTCLAKDPEARFQSAHDLKLQLGWIGLADAQRESAVTQRSAKSAWWAAVALMVLAGATALWVGSRWRSLPQTYQFEINAPEKAVFNFRGLAGPPVVSPDGSKIAFVASSLDQVAARSLWWRSLDSLEVKRVQGSEGAMYPFWSPDGRFLAFFVAGKLKKFDLAGANLVTICDVAEGRGGAWSTDGVILFGNRADSLFRVDAAGGKPVVLTTLDEKRLEISHRWPQFLPDQKRFLYVAQAPEIPSARLYVASLDSPAGKPLEGFPPVARYAHGYLLYVQESNLLARQFDQERLQFTDEPVVLAEHVQIDPQFNNAVFSVSDSALIFQTGGVAAGTRLTSFDRGGKETILNEETELIQQIGLSPAGDEIVATVGLSSGQLNDIWIFNLPKHTKKKFTFDQHGYSPVWSPDGQRIAFERPKPDGSEIVIKSVLGDGSEEVVLKENQRAPPIAWSKDGRYLIYRLGYRTTSSSNASSTEVKAVPIQGDHKPVPLLSTKLAWGSMKLSPDGKWLAYASFDSGIAEAYVVPFHSGPDGVGIGTGKWQVTNGGGSDPAWRPDGKELFFVENAGSSLSSVSINTAGGNVEAGAPHQLFDLPAHPVGSFYAPASGGQILYMTTYGPGSSSPITVTVNWQKLLKK